MSLFDRMVAGEFRKSKSEPVATLATFATEGSVEGLSVATVATVAATQKVKSLSPSQLSELRSLIGQSCEPHERDGMFVDALPCGINSITTYKNIVVDRALPALEKDLIANCYDTHTSKRLPA